ncbi:hypothetical protein C7C46_08980 [Streptomyces tateyamensis]|uniref:HK97 gp10 family phage protein n=1 Tax=Streptomyces tateyamensis TaxID=565073 RepID=A0A2V4NT69_9ACTN|nr:hypothetical protein [Streptomyces tateyamensis]PYC83456.1 hypothetical protein C7C46_08980 [Streptomyces tateyamensis]
MSLIVTGLTEVVTALQRAPNALQRNVRTAVERTARTVRDDARSRIRGHRYLPRYPASITYDITATAAGVTAEIGPDKGRPQGALGNIVEYGTSKNAPIPHLGPALDAAEPDVEAGINAAVQDALA